MKRLLILAVEVEQPEGLSSRKLILESLKHNVVTAFSGEEALELLTRVKPDIALVHSHVQNPSCEDLVPELKRHSPEMKVAVLSPSDSVCSTEDFRINSLQPAQLVRFFHQLSQELLGTQPSEHPGTRIVPMEVPV